MHHPSTSRGYVHRLRPLRLGFAIWVLLGIAGCASAVPNATADQSEHKTEAALLQQINTSIGQASCDTDDQCRTLGLGANACGGPAAWRPWSTQTSGQGESLQALAEQLSALQRRRQTQNGMVSTCRYIPNPGAQCLAQRCVLKKNPDPAS